MKVNDYEREFKFTSNFTQYWAKKKNKTWMKVNKVLAQEMKRMYEQGEGYKNKATRYTPEQAVAELRERFLVDKWDQRLIVLVKILKGKFSVWFRNENKKGDNQRAAAADATAVDVATAEDKHVDSVEDALTGEAAASFAKVFNEESDVQLSDDVADDVRDIDELAVGMVERAVNGEEE